MSSTHNKTVANRSALRLTRSFRVRLATLVVAFLFGATPGAAKTLKPGVIPGELTVTNSGQANYTIGIATPMGKAKIEPNLTINYASNRVNGLLGTGWTISGLSVITRCGASYCLDGTKLVHQDGDVFKKPIDDFSRIIGKEKDNLGSYTRFIVKTPSGTRYQYGNEAGSRLETSAGNPRTKTWGLSRIIDANSNYLDIKYANSGQTNTLIPERVLYTGNLRAGVSPYNEIIFTYQHRPDASVACARNQPMVSDKRLRMLTVKGAGKLFRRYFFTYNSAVATAEDTADAADSCRADIRHRATPNTTDFSPSQLKEIRVCGSGGACYPATHFNYSNDDAQWLSSGGGLNTVTLGTSDAGEDSDSTSAEPQANDDAIFDTPAPGDSTVEIEDWFLEQESTTERQMRSWLGRVGKFIDLNNDGLKDYIVAARHPESKKDIQLTWLNSGSSWRLVPGYALPALHTSKYGHEVGQFVDLNGDGLPDWTFAHKSLSGTQLIKQLINTGRGWREATTYKSSTLQTLRVDYGVIRWSERVDINLDGRADIIHARRIADGSVREHTYYATDDGYEKHTGAPVLSRPLLEIADDQFVLAGEFKDLNNDGQLDYIWRGDDRILISFGQRDTHQYHFQGDRFRRLLVANPRESRGEFVDINGDGQLDWVRSAQLEDGTTLSDVFVATPTAFERRDDLALPLIRHNAYDDPVAHLIDINRDGNLDMVAAVRRINDSVAHSVYLNTGDGWVEDPGSTLPRHVSVAANELRAIELGEFLDANGDGQGDWIQTRLDPMTDVAGHGDAYLQESSSWINEQRFGLPHLTIASLWDLGGGVSESLDLIANEVGEEPDEPRSTDDLLPPLAGYESFGPGNLNIDAVRLADPSAYTSFSQRPSDAIYGDVNGDGRMDWIQAIRHANGSESKQIKLNTKTGWLTGPTPPTALYDSDGNTLSVMADLNGDRIADWVQAVDDDGDVTLATWVGGNGWTNAPQLALPTALHRRTANGQLTQTATLIDINRDGFPDVVEAYVTESGERHFNTWLNNGVTFLKSDKYVLPVAMFGQGSDGVWRRNARFLDVDGDGQLDFAVAVHVDGVNHLHTWLGRNGAWVKKERFALPRALFGADGRPGAHLVDVNGDALVDFVLASRTSDGKSYLVTWLNTGYGWSRHDAYALPVWLHDYLSDPSGQQLADFMDVNNDGRPDLIQSLKALDGKTYGGVWLNTGRGWALRPGKGPAALLSAKDGGKLTRVASWTDLDGDGQLDWTNLTAQPDSHSAHRLANGGHGRLTEVVDGLGNASRITYRSAINSDIVSTATIHSSTARAVPTHNLVVSNVTFPDGIGGVKKVSHQYGGAVIPAPGRPSNGFTWRSSHDSVTGRTNTVEFSREHPFTGRVVLEETRIASGQVVSRTERTWKRLTAGVAENALTMAPDTTVTSSYDPQGALLGVNTKSFEYGIFAQVTKTVEDRSVGNETNRVVTEHSYSANTSGHIFFDLDQSVVTLQKFVDNVAGVAVTNTEIYGYDDYGNLISRTAEPGVAKQVKTRQTFDSFGNVLTAKTWSGGKLQNRVETEFDKESGRFPIKVTEAGNLTTAQSFDQATGNIISATSPNGVTTRTEYDGFGQRLRDIMDDTSVSATTQAWCNSMCPPNGRFMNVMVDSFGAAPEAVYVDSLGREVRRLSYNSRSKPVYQDTEYDAAGRVVAKSMPYERGKNPRWARYTYDALGRKIRIVAPDGNVTRNVYEGNSVTLIDALQRRTKRTFGVDQRILSVVDAKGEETRYDYDARGNMTKVVDPLGNTTRFTFDRLGRRIMADDPDTGITVYKYDALHRLVSETDASDTTMRLEYDLAGRLVKRIEKETTTTWNFDDPDIGLGRLASVSNGEFSESYEYDDLGRTTRATQAFRMEEPVTLETQYVGNSNSIASLRYPGGFSVSYAYDSMGYMKEISYGAIDEYNKYLNRLKHARQVVETANKLNDVLAVQIDHAKVHEAEALRLAGIAQSHANNANRLVSIANKAANQANFHSGKVEEYRTRAYEATEWGGTEHQIDLLMDKAEEHLALYDDQIRRMNSAERQAGAAAASAKSWKAKADAEYKSAEGWADKAAATAKQRDALHVRYEEHIAVGERWLEEHKARADKSIWKAAAHDDLGRATSIELGNGLVTTRTYDPVSSRISSIKTGTGANTASIQDAEFGFDPLGNLTSRTDHLRDLTERFEYDSLNRIVRVDYNNNLASEDFEYDAIDNIASRSSLGSYSYGAGLGHNDISRRAGPHAVTAVGSTRYKYDRVGNITNSGDRKVTWASFRKPVVFEKGETTTKFQYGPNRNRVRQTETTRVDGETVTGETRYYHGGVYQEYRKGNATTYTYGVVAADDTVATYTVIDDPDADAAEILDASQSNDAGDSALDPTTDVNSSGDTATENPARAPPAERLVDRLPDGAIARAIRDGFNADRNESLLPALRIAAGDEEDELSVLDAVTALDAELRRTALTQVLNDRPGLLLLKLKAIDSNATDIDAALASLSNGQIRLAVSAVLEHVDAAQRFISQYHRARAVDAKFANFTRNWKERESKLWAYMHVDHINSVTAITDGDGVVIDRFAYDVFGRPMVVFTDGTTFAEILYTLDGSYTGHEQLASMELTHMNGRVYDASIGRFLSADPFVHEPFRPQNLNRYTYVYNNPLSLTDPSGFEVEHKTKGAMRAYEHFLWRDVQLMTRSKISKKDMYQAFKDLNYEYKPKTWGPEDERSPARSELEILAIEAAHHANGSAILAENGISTEAWDNVQDTIGVAVEIKKTLSAMAGWKKYTRIVVALAITIASQGAATKVGMAIGRAIAAGVGSNFDLKAMALAFVGAYAMASVGEAFQSLAETEAISSAYVDAVDQGLNPFQILDAMDGAKAIASIQTASTAIQVQYVAVHMIVGGAMTDLGGGSFTDGMIAGGVNATLSVTGFYTRLGLDAIGTTPGGKAINFVVAGTIGGLAAAAAGGDFEDAFWHAGVARLYNDMSHGSEAEAAANAADDRPWYQKMRDAWNDSSNMTKAIIVGGVAVAVVAGVAVVVAGGVGTAGAAAVSVATRVGAQIYVNASSAGSVVLAGSMAAQRGGPMLHRLSLHPDKFRYLFGLVNSSPHNAARSQQLLQSFSRIGIHNTPQGRQVLTEHFKWTIKQSDNIIKTFTKDGSMFHVRESLLMGPNGGLRLHTTFRLTTNGTKTYHQFSTVIPKN